MRVPIRGGVGIDMSSFRMTVVAAVMRNLSAHSSLADIVTSQSPVCVSKVRLIVINSDPRQKLDLNSPPFTVTTGCNRNAYHIQDQKARQARGAARIPQVGGLSPPLRNILH